MSDFNFDENTINKVKNMMDNGELDSVMSKISPEMIQNFSSMLNGSSNNENSNHSSNNNNNSNSTNNKYSKSSTNSNNSNSQGNFDFNNIDIDTIMKINSAIKKMNNKNDPRSNLLYSLKPYLREEKQEKLDQYANLMNVAKLAELFKNNEKGSKK